jgi:hypothetical protein
MKVGERAGAIQSLDSTAGIVNLYGYGVYEGYLPLPKRFDGLSGVENPCILLDSGERVYGMECWWAEEARIKEMVEKCHTINIAKVEE